MKSPDQKIKSTAKNKIRRIEKQIKLHPPMANNLHMMDRLKFWKSKI